MTRAVGQGPDRAHAPRVAAMWTLRWLVGSLCLVLAPVAAALPMTASTAEPPAGRPAPPEVLRELTALVALAVQRFEAKDTAGVLALVSEQYRTGPFTKRVVREQLMAMYSVYDAVRARVHVDDVRMVDGHAWVYSTGELTGRLPLVGSWIRFLSWQRELEVARREAGGWRLFGYQQ